MVRSKYIGWAALAALVVVVAAALGGFSVAPWALVVVALACPLMMLFVMADMRGGGSSGGIGNHTSRPTLSDSK
jgi:hypothetical protein